MEVQLFVRKVYGRNLVYCYGDRAKYIQVLTGRTTLYDEDIEALKGLGFEIQWVEDPNPPDIEATNIRKKLAIQKAVRVRKEKELLKQETLKKEE